MALFDTHINFGYSTIAGGGVIGSTTGTTLQVQTGDITKFAATQNIVVWPANAVPTVANAEIMRVTSVDSQNSTLTVTRAQENTTALGVITAGYQVNSATTKKTLTDIEGLFPVTEANLSISDNTTGDVSSSAHGFAPKAWASAWVPWTPSWTNLTIGNATVVAKYLQHGKGVWARIHVVFGSTTSISGDVSFSLPVTSAAVPNTANLDILGRVSMYDANATINFGYITLSTTTTANLRAENASTTYVQQSVLSSTVPFNWTTNYEIGGSFFYEAA